MKLTNIAKEMFQIVDAFLTLIEFSMMKLNEKVL